jgi:hypothetical protein
MITRQGVDFVQGPPAGAVGSCCEFIGDAVAISPLKITPVPPLLFPVPPLLSTPVSANKTK